MRSGGSHHMGGQREPSGDAPLVCNTSHRGTGVGLLFRCGLMGVSYKEGHLNSEG